MDRKPQFDYVSIFTYTRISPTELEGDTPEAREADVYKKLGLQDKRIEAFLADRFPNATITRYSDLLVSGKQIDHRESFQKLLADAHAQKPFAIVFTKIDRAFRNLREMLNTEAELRADKVNLIATDQQNIDTTSAWGRAAFQQMGVFSELEGSLIVERTNYGKKEKQKEMEAAGRNWGRPRGVYRDKVTGELRKLDENEVMKLSLQGQTYKQLAMFFHCSEGAIRNIVNCRHKKLNIESPEASLPHPQDSS